MNIASYDTKSIDRRNFLPCFSVTMREIIRYEFDVICIQNLPLLGRDYIDMYMEISQVLSDNTAANGMPNSYAFEIFVSNHPREGLFRVVIWDTRKVTKLISRDLRLSYVVLGDPPTYYDEGKRGEKIRTINSSLFLFEKRGRKFRVINSSPPSDGEEEAEYWRNLLSIASEEYYRRDPLFVVGSLGCYNALMMVSIICRSNGLRNIADSRSCLIVHRHMANQARFHSDYFRMGVRNGHVTYCRC